MATLYAPAAWPTPIPINNLVGRLVRLELITQAHVTELARAGSDPRVWRFTTSRADTIQSMQAYVAQLTRDWETGTACPFAVRSVASDEIVGCTRLKELDRAHRKCLVGSWYAASVWRTGVNLESKLLLLEYAFQRLGCVRVEFHTDAENERSRSSLEKLGAKFEGVLRAHQITREGTLRDSAIYSLLANEWEGIRARIEERLAR